jgi:hypothetical protein
MYESVDERKIGMGVIMGRLFLLVAAVVAFAAAMGLGHWQGQPASDASARYVCPMHPQVVSPVPKDCPICNMALERVHEAKQAEAPATSRVTFAEVRRRTVTQVVRVPACLGPGGVVMAVMHKESLEGSAPGQKALFFRGSEPATAIAVERTADAIAPWDAATVQVRFASKQEPLSDRDTGWLQLDATARALLLVPESSVLYSGEGAYVLVGAQDGDAIVPRFVQVGQILDSGYLADLAEERLGAVAVLSGLHEGERVVTADTFFLDAERRLRSPAEKPEEANP